ncbi:hypothetical protein B1C78_05085 [Thioalkalivibrio denitrificans]|uniref:Uncharacterized protein n=1 Tax=Thioalkalivibrio denitrificans TaxID=108003 RepID=A0A1V3NN12_9GAMM|nr:hypothetical protein [Thioalkalivibrio denitrificans]OOG26440.1 hypothetical protein B1C78_05085 [Thioalkalivibrio denitrificans]
MKRLLLILLFGAVLLALGTMVFLPVSEMPEQVDRPIGDEPIVTEPPYREDSREYQMAPDRPPEMRDQIPTLPRAGTSVQPHKPLPELDQYKVELGADEVLSMPGEPGRMQVWIGAMDVEPARPPGMIFETDTLPAVGQTAKITPQAPAFDVFPSESICLLIHPSGSSKQFHLTPREPGTFRVGAEVYLYNSQDCTGAPVPKAVTHLQVTVKVDRARQVRSHAHQIWLVTWEAFLDFWGALLVIFFGVLLVLFRKRLRGLFRLDD